MDEQMNQTEQIEKSESNEAEQIEQLKADIARMKFESEAAAALLEAGAIELEAAVIICKNDKSKAPQSSTAQMVSEMADKRRYLFAPARMSMRTNPPAIFREQSSNLEKACSKAMETGNANELMEYMRARRALKA